MEVTLRPATAQDEAFLYRVYDSTRGEEMAFAALPPEQQQALIRIQFTAQRQAYAVKFPDAIDGIIMIDGQPAGRLLVNHSPEEIRLVDIALLPEYRNHGTGAGLIKRLQVEALIEQKPLRLQVAITNRAVRLYQRLGFVATNDGGSHLQMEWRPK